MILLGLTVTVNLSLFILCHKCAQSVWLWLTTQNYNSQPLQSSLESLRPASSETMTLSFIDLVLIYNTSLSCSVSHWWKFPDHCSVQYQPVCFCLCCIKKRSLFICYLYILYMPDSSVKAAMVQWGSDTTVNQWGNPQPVVKYRWINCLSSIMQGLNETQLTQNKWLAQDSTSLVIPIYVCV